MRYLRILALMSLCTLVATAPAVAQTPASQPEARSLDEMLTAEQLREDADFVFEQIKEIHPDMHAYVSEAEYAPVKEALYARLDKPMTRREFFMVLAPAVASLQVGHTLIYPPLKEFKEYREAGGKVHPVIFSREGQEIRLGSYHGQGELPVGGTILSINSQSAAEVLDRLARCFPSERKPMNYLLLEDPTTLWAMLWIEFEAEKPLKLRIRDLDGGVGEHAVEPTFIDRRTIRKIERTLLRDDYAYRHIPEHDAGLIVCKAFEDRSGFKNFLKKHFQEMRDTGVTSLIVDLRDNIGGDTRISDALLRYISHVPFRQFLQIDTKVSPRIKKMTETDMPIGEVDVEKINPKGVPENPLLFEGDVYVLIGPNCFSTGVALASTIQHFRIGKLVGQETGDATSLFGFQLYSTLPNSEWLLSVPAKRYVAAGSNEDGRGALPDYPVEPDPDEEADGIDTVLAYTLRLIDQARPAVPEAEQPEAEEKGEADSGSDE